MEDDKPDINLKKFRKHEKTFPWSLIRKLVIAIILGGVLFYLYKTLEQKPKKINDTELEIEFPD
jgi:uncharacterized membrane protein